LKTINRRKKLLLLLCTITGVLVICICAYLLYVFINKDPFYDIATKGAWHEYDTGEKSQYNPVTRETIPIYRRIETPPNLLYIEPNDIESLFITDDLGLRAMELDKNGYVVWEYLFDANVNYFGIYPYGEDEVIVSMLNYGRVVIVNKITDEVRILIDVPVRDVQVISPNEILLMENLEKGRALIVNGNGEIIWESEPLFYWSRGVWMKQDGNILVTDFYNKAYEIDYNTKEIIWEVDGFKSPGTIQEMANGNYLIADEHRNRVIEINPQTNRVVRKYTNVYSPNAARELPNGDWLIADSDNGRIIRINHKQHIIYEVSNLNNPNKAIPVMSSGE